MKYKRVLITGGAGFVGSHLVDYFSQKDLYKIVIFDKLQNTRIEKHNQNVVYFRGDIQSQSDVRRVFKKHGPFKTVYHLASAMPNKAVSDRVLWQTNTLGTFNVVSQAVKNKVKSFIFTSSNVTYGIPKSLPVTEETLLNPLEIYGRSKEQAEKELAKFKKHLDIQIVRCPVITGVGRLGLQAILYEFISENRNIYLLGDGSNKYQFVDVMDVVSALEKASDVKGFDVYNIGADGILSLKDIYKKVIKFAGSKSKIIPLPKTPTILILALLDKLNMSPLGIYQYTMMGESIYFDTRKIKKKLDWKSGKTNLDTFIENYIWYKENKGKFVEIGSDSFSANKSLPKLGAFKLLKMLS